MKVYSDNLPFTGIGALVQAAVGLVLAAGGALMVKLGRPRRSRS